jgi:hypothetical protein
MVDEKKKAEYKAPIFHRVVEKKDTRNGEFLSSVSVDLNDWEFNGKKGHSIRIMVNKSGKRSYINIDPANADVKKAIAEVYQAYEKLK